MRFTQPDRRRSTDGGTTASGTAASRTTADRKTGSRKADGRKADGRKAAGTLAEDAGRRVRAGDRRHRERLRELCDEVLASYRAAAGGEAMSASERAEAERLLAEVAPLPRD